MPVRARHWKHMLSTVEFSRNIPVAWANTLGRQESNLRHPVLETGALTELSYTPMFSCFTRKPPCPGFRGGAAQLDFQLF